MKEKEIGDTDQQDLSSQVPNIPDLKKKDKERKRAGAAWGGGRPAGTPFTGATGGSGSGGLTAVVGAGRGAAGAAQGAAGASGALGGAAGSAASRAGMGWLSSWLGGSSGWLGGLGASFLSKALIGIGAAALMAGVGLYAYQRTLAREAQRQSPVILSPISSPIAVHRTPSDERLRMAAQAGHGQFQFDPQEAPEPTTTPAGDEAQATAGAGGTAEKPAETPWGDILSGFQAKGGIASQGLSGLPSGSGFGGQKLFSSLTGAGARGGTSGNMPSLRSTGQKGRLSGAFAKGSTRSTNARALSTRNIRSSRAFAQLRTARGLSLMAARGSSSEQGMRTTAADAFDQTQTQGGQIGAIDSAVPANPAGGGGASGGEYGTAPLLSDPNALPDQPVSPPGAVDPGQQQNYQDPMDAIKQLAAMAAKLKQISEMLIKLGLMLMVIGGILMCFPYTYGAGCAIFGAGCAVLAMGLMMLSMAQQMGAQAKAMGDQLSTAMGQQYEQENVSACVDQAVAAGTDPNACNSPHNNDNTHNDHTTISDDVDAERNSSAEYDDGTPVFER